MKEIVESPSIDLSMAFLNEKEVEAVRSWFGYLANWEEDKEVRDNCIAVPNHPGVYMLRTPSDLRIFFRIEGNKIYIIKLGSRQAILATAGIREEDSAEFHVSPAPTMEK